MSEKDTAFAYKKVKRGHFRVIAPKKAAGPLDIFVKPTEKRKSPIINNLQY